MRFVTKNGLAVTPLSTEEQAERGKPLEIQRTILLDPTPEDKKGMPQRGVVEFVDELDELCSLQRRN